MSGPPPRPSPWVERAWRWAVLLPGSAALLAANAALARVAGSHLPPMAGLDRLDVHPRWTSSPWHLASFLAVVALAVALAVLWAVAGPIGLERAVARELALGVREARDGRGCTVEVAVRAAGLRPPAFGLAVGAPGSPTRTLAAAERPDRVTRVVAPVARWLRRRGLVPRWRLVVETGEGKERSELRGGPEEVREALRGAGRRVRALRARRALSLPRVAEPALTAVLLELARRATLPPRRTRRRRAAASAVLLLTNVGLTVAGLVLVLRALSATVSPWLAREFGVWAVVAALAAVPAGLALETRVADPVTRTRFLGRELPRALARAGADGLVVVAASRQDVTVEHGLGLVLGGGDTLEPLGWWSLASRDRWLSLVPAVAARAAAADGTLGRC